MRWVIFLAVFVFAGICGARTPEPLSKGTRELFAWYDRLGFEDTSKAKFVRIRTGASVVMGDTERQDDEMLGWVFEDDGPTFRAMLADLTVGLFTKQGNVESDPSFCGYREVSMEEEARKVIRALKDPKYFEKWDEPHFRYYDRLSRRGQIFAMARACAQRGLTRLAEELMRALNKTEDNLTERVKRDLHWPFSWRLQCEFRSPTATWAEILAGYKLRRELFPEESSRKTIESTIADLEKVVAEEAEDARRGLVDLAKLPVPERAKELVRRLRNEVDERTDEQNGRPRPWPWKERGSNGALEGLRALGFAAVPALIDELRSGRASRSMHFSSRGGIWLQETNNLAITVLNELSGVELRYLTPGSGPYINERGEALAKVAQHWFTMVQTKGEKQWLTEVVTEGGRGVEWCLARLREKFPDVAVETMLAGAAKNTNERGRAAIVGMLAKEKGAVVEEFFRKELREGSTLERRIVAAAALREHGIAEGDEVILGEWRKFLKAWEEEKPKAVSAGSGTPEVPGMTDNGSEMLTYLLSTGSPKIMHALEQAWADLPTDLRMLLISKIAALDLSSNAVAWGTAQREARTWAKEILLAALEETAVYLYNASSDEGSYANPRVCDLAGDALHRLWPEKFAFDIYAPKSARDRQRIAMLNPHRREAGLEELPVHPRRAQVAEGKARDVAAVEWDAASAKAPAALERKLSGLKGKPLAARAIAEMMLDYAVKPIAGTTEFVLEVEREGDGTGVIVRARLVAGKLEKPTMCSYSELVQLGRRNLRSSDGGGMVDAKSKARDWEELSNALSQALAAPATEAMHAEVRLKVEE